LQVWIDRKVWETRGKERVGIVAKAKGKKIPDTYQTEGCPTAYLVRANAEPASIQHEMPTSLLAST
jgi:hypothetical protein